MSGLPKYSGYSAALFICCPSNACPKSSYALPFLRSSMSICCFLVQFLVPFPSQTNSCSRFQASLTALCLSRAFNNSKGSFFIFYTKQIIKVSQEIIKIFINKIFIKFTFFWKINSKLVASLFIKKSIPRTQHTDYDIVIARPSVFTDINQRARAPRHRDRHAGRQESSPPSLKLSPPPHCLGLLTSDPLFFPKPVKSALQKPAQENSLHPEF